MVEIERRKYKRVTFDGLATLRSPQKEIIRSEVIDLSLKGVLLDIDHIEESESANFTLEIELDDSTKITMQLELKHKEGGHAGFTCTQIDIDSMTHLRRLVELNMGSSELLDRELEELIR
ncbi:MAG: PilZ domain-containing protein [Gammaproteobacteria bacterium]|nr:MAG: PilZ domain-containing protein [Gammaproteobacteria bacterium]